MSGTRTFTIVLVGDCKTGKSTFLRRHKTGEFQKDYVPTKGFEITPLTFYTSDGAVKLVVYDCSGDYESRILWQMTFCLADAAILFFDVTDTSSYDHLNNWYSNVCSFRQGIPMIVVGNKIDCCDDDASLFHKITFDHEHKIKYFSVSAKSNYNYEKPFLYLMRALLKNDELKWAEAPSIPVPEYGEALSSSSEADEQEKDRLKQAQEQVFREAAEKRRREEEEKAALISQQQELQKAQEEEKNRLKEEIESWKKKYQEVKRKLDAISVI